MKLWKISRKDRIGYDEYDSAVVAAETEEQARNIHPCHSRYDGTGVDWDAPKNLTVQYLGATDRAISGVILASFNAG